MLSIKQLAERLGIATSTAYRIVSARRIGHHKVAGVIRISEEQIAEYLDATQVERIDPFAPRVSANHWRPRRQPLRCVIDPRLAKRKPKAEK